MRAPTQNKNGPDPLGRYYTADTVSSTLVREMNLRSPKIIMDLGVGDGALTKEAAKLWKSAQLVTVDIDRKTSFRTRIPNSSHYTHDALSSTLHTRIGLSLGSVDGAVCNPPYIRARWRNDFAVILEDAGLSGALPSIKNAGADILFIAQNLRFLRKSGRLGLILPDGLVAGEKFAQLRRLLLTQHKIERVIELPRRIFKMTDAKAHIVILTKKASGSEFVTVERMELDGTLSPPLHVTTNAAIHRLDYSYLVSQSANQASTNFAIGDVCESLSRGKLNSVDAKNARAAVFHSTDFPPITDNTCPPVPRKFLITEATGAQLETVVAQTGDILICRVGRNLEDKVCFVPKGRVALSDCIYRLRIEKAFRQDVMNFLCNQTGRSKLEALAHGVGAKYLCKSDLLNFVVERVQR